MGISLENYQRTLCRGVRRAGGHLCGHVNLLCAAQSSESATGSATDAPAAGGPADHFSGEGGPPQLAGRPPAGPAGAHGPGHQRAKGRLPDPSLPRSADHWPLLPCLSLSLWSVRRVREVIDLGGQIGRRQMPMTLGSARAWK